MIAKIRGKDLYYEDLGEESSKAVLYIHGGPGGIGGLDFLKYQVKSISKNFRVIVPDQRGVWKSEKLGEDEEITLDDIVEDYEELRKELNIEKWTLLSHSFGGYVSILYADKYPSSIESLVLENPSFDFALSERSMLKKSIEIMKHYGKEEIAERYEKSLDEAKDYHEVSEILGKSFNELGEHANEIMWAESTTDIIGNLVRSSENGKEKWINSSKMRMKLLSSGCLYKSAFYGIKVIEKPCLLIKGEKDPITCEKQISLLKENVPGTKVQYVHNSSHWTHIEKPKEYAEIVREFINSIDVLSTER